jgi:hypothetical protein
MKLGLHTVAAPPPGMGQVEGEERAEADKEDLRRFASLRHAKQRHVPQRNAMFLN